MDFASMSLWATSGSFWWDCPSILMGALWAGRQKWRRGVPNMPTNDRYRYFGQPWKTRPIWRVWYWRGATSPGPTLRRGAALHWFPQLFPTPRLTSICCCCWRGIRSRWSCGFSPTAALSPSRDWSSTRHSVSPWGSIQRRGRTARDRIDFCRVSSRRGSRAPGRLISGFVVWRWRPIVSWDHCSISLFRRWRWILLWFARNLWLWFPSGPVLSDGICLWLFRCRFFWQLRIRLIGRFPHPSRWSSASRWTIWCGTPRFWRRGCWPSIWKTPWDPKVVLWGCTICGVFRIGGCSRAWCLRSFGKFWKFSPFWHYP